MGPLLKSLSLASSEYNIGCPDFPGTDRSLCEANASTLLGSCQENFRSRVNRKQNASENIVGHQARKFRNLSVRDPERRPVKDDLEGYLYMTPLTNSLT